MARTKHIREEESGNFSDSDRDTDGWLAQAEAAEKRNRYNNAG